MKVSEVSSVQNQNFSANSKAEKKQTATPKEVKNDKSKLVLALTGLGAAALAGVAIYKNQHKAAQQAGETAGKGVNKALEKIRQDAGSFTPIEEFKKSGGRFKRGCALEFDDEKLHGAILVKQKDGYRVISYGYGSPYESKKYDNLGNAISEKKFDNGKILNYDLINPANNTKTYILRNFKTGRAAAVETVSADGTVMKEWSQK